MEPPKFETIQSFDFIEVEDKNFEKQFVDTEGKIWEGNNHSGTNQEGVCGQSNSSYEIDIPKIEPEEFGECVKVETDMNALFDGEPVFIKCEKNDFDIDGDENGANIHEIKVKFEENSEIIASHKELSSADLVQEEQEVVTTRRKNLQVSWK